MNEDQKLELEALNRADKELEAVQDQTRGATRVKGIRALILKRILELENEK